MLEKTITPAASTSFPLAWMKTYFVRRKRPSPKPMRSKPKRTSSEPLLGETDLIGFVSNLGCEPYWLILTLVNRGISCIGVGLLSSFLSLPHPKRCPTLSTALCTEHLVDDLHSTFASPRRCRCLPPPRQVHRPSRRTTGRPSSKRPWARPRPSGRPCHCGRSCCSTPKLSCDPGESGESGGQDTVSNMKKLQFHSDHLPSVALNENCRSDLICR